MQTDKVLFWIFRANYRSLDEQPLVVSIDMTVETIPFASEVIQAIYILVY